MKSKFINGNECSQKPISELIQIKNSSSNTVYCIADDKRIKFSLWPQRSIQLSMKELWKIENFALLWCSKLIDFVCPKIKFTSN